MRLSRGLLQPDVRKPAVSVLVPIYNEGDSINLFLESVFRQAYRGIFEVLLIDGMSEDGTRDKIKVFVSQNSGPLSCKDNIQVKVVDNPRKIVPCGLNSGIMKARGGYVIRMDAHTEYDSNYITGCVKWLDENKAENVGGPTESVPGANTLIAKGIALASSSIFGVGNSKFRTSARPQYVDTVPFGAWSKRTFEKIGFFDERLARGQDIEHNSRIRNAGGKIYLTPEIKSYYHCDSTLSELWKKHFANGQWNIYTAAITSGALSWRHFVPMGFVLAMIFSILFSIAPLEHRYLPFALIAGSYFITSLLFSLMISFKKGFKCLPILPSIFAVMHFSYGLGSIWGLITLPGWLKENRFQGKGIKG